MILGASGLPAEEWPLLENALGPLAKNPTLLPPIARALSLVGPERALSWSQENEVARGFSPKLLLALFDLLKTLDPRHTTLLELLTVAPEHGLPTEIIEHIDPHLLEVLDELVRWGFVWGHDGCLRVSSFARALTTQRSEGSEEWSQARRQIIDATVTVSKKIYPYFERSRAVRIEQIVDTCLHWLLSPDTQVPGDGHLPSQIALISFLLIYPIRGSQKESILLSKTLEPMLASVPESNRALRGEILFWMGVSRQRYDQNEEGNRHLLSALELFSSANEWPVHKAYLSRELVNWLRDAPEIQPLVLRLLEDMKKSKNKIEVAMGNLNLCILQERSSASTDRIHLLEEVILMSNSIPAGSKKMRFFAYDAIGEIHAISKNWSEAVRFFEICISISNHRLPIHWANSHRVLAFCFLSVQNGNRQEYLRRALFELHASLTVFQPHLYPDTYKDIKTREAEILEELAKLQN